MARHTKRCPARTGREPRGSRQSSPPARGIEARQRHDAPRRQGRDGSRLRQAPARATARRWAWSRGGLQVPKTPYAANGQRLRDQPRRRQKRHPEPTGDDRRATGAWRRWSPPRPGDAGRRHRRYAPRPVGEARCASRAPALEAARRWALPRGRPWETTTPSAASAQRLQEQSCARLRGATPWDAST